jgi:hypothetical protein
MKTERRHELEANELAIRLGKITEAIQPRARTVVAGIVVIAAIALIIQYSGSTSSTRQTEGWDRYAAAASSGDTFELDSLGEEFKLAPVGSWARLVLADQYLSTGVRETFRDRAKANSDIDRAIENYEVVRENASDDLIKQRAHFGLGRAHESLSKLGEAEQDYKAIVDGWPESALAVAAQSRLDDLALRRTREFYDWFAAQTPQAEFLSDEPGTPGARPDFDLDTILSPSGDVDLNLNAPVTDDKNPAEIDITIPRLIDDSETEDGSPPAAPAAPDDASEEDAATESTNDAVAPESTTAPEDAAEPGERSSLD